MPREIILVKEINGKRSKTERNMCQRVMVSGLKRGESSFLRMISEAKNIADKVPKAKPTKSLLSKLSSFGDTKIIKPTRQSSKAKRELFSIFSFKNIKARKTRKKGAK